MLFFRKILYLGMYTNKCYKRVFVQNKVEIKNIKMGEDVDFNIDVFQNIENIVTLEKCYYHYVKSNTNSATAKFIRNYWNIHIELLNKEINLFKIWGKQKKQKSLYVMKIY